MLGRAADIPLLELTCGYRSARRSGSTARWPPNASVTGSSSAAGGFGHGGGDNGLDAVSDHPGVDTITVHQGPGRTWTGKTDHGTTSWLLSDRPRTTPNCRR